MSYKEKRLYEILPIEIEELENKITSIEKELSNPDLYVQDTQRFNLLTNELCELKQQKDEKETKWLEIELMFEN